MAKRSGGWARVTLDEPVAQSDPPDIDLLDLDAALSELASFDPRKSQVAELTQEKSLMPRVEGSPAEVRDLMAYLTRLSNAGAGPVASWRATPIADDAEWIETIPYDETRGYVKRILRSMQVYRMLHP